MEGLISDPLKSGHASPFKSLKDQMKQKNKRNTTELREILELGEGLRKYGPTQSPYNWIV